MSDEEDDRDPAEAQRRKATLVDGVIMPGGWFVPARGPHRRHTRVKAQKFADWISTFYGPGVYEAKIEEEPSRKDPGVTVFQVYIRSLGAMEGLRKR